jgi:hypothetical protein
MRLFRSSVTDNTTPQHLTTDRRAPRDFAIDRMAAATLAVVAVTMGVGGLALYDLSGIVWFLLLLVPAAIGVLGAYWWFQFIAKEIELRYPRVQTPPAMELPKPQPKAKRWFWFRRRGKPPERIEMDDWEDETPKKLPGFDLTEADLRAFVSRACEFGLSRTNMVPDGHKIQLPSGDELSRGTYDRVIDHMATLGWVEKRGKGQTARWAVTRRELPRLIDEEARRAQ